MVDIAFRFTKSFDVSSSFIGEVLFNENEGFAVIDVNGEMYKYDDVTENDVVDLIEADSVGAYYNQVWKDEFGPSEHLGSYGDIWWDTESVVKNNFTPTTPKGLLTKEDLIRVGGKADIHAVSSTRSNEETKEYSLNVFDQSVSGAPIATNDEPTKEFSLTLVDNGDGIDESETVLDGVSAVVVHFSLDDYDRKYKFAAQALNVEDAIEELHQHVKVLGAKGRVRKVVVKFD